MDETFTLEQPAAITTNDTAHDAAHVNGENDRPKQETKLLNEEVNPANLVTTEDTIIPHVGLEEIKTPQQVIDLDDSETF